MSMFSWVYITYIGGGGRGTGGHSLWQKIMIPVLSKVWAIFFLYNHFHGNFWHWHFFEVHTFWRERGSGKVYVLYTSEYWHFWMASKSGEFPFKNSEYGKRTNSDLPPHPPVGFNYQRSHLPYIYTIYIFNVLAFNPQNLIQYDST